MKSMMLFHRSLFVMMVIVAFLLGALNAGRANALERREIQLLLMLDVKQLTEVRLDV